MKFALKLVPLLGLLLAGCASSPIVKTDADPSANFTAYHTYTWAQKPKDLPPLQQQRLVAAIDAKLQQQGWTQSADGQVALVANVATREKQTLDTFYSGPTFAGWGWRNPWRMGPAAYWGPGFGPGMGMGDATTTVDTYTVGTLVLDMFDTKTKQAVWRGSVSGDVPDSPQKLDAAIQAGVDRMFATFPDKPAS